MDGRSWDRCCGKENCKATKPEPKLARGAVVLGAWYQRKPGARPIPGAGLGAVGASGLRDCETAALCRRVRPLTACPALRSPTGGKDRAGRSKWARQEPALAYEGGIIAAGCLRLAGLRRSRRGGWRGLLPGVASREKVKENGRDGGRIVPYRCWYCGGSSWVMMDSEGGQ